MRTLLTRPSSLACLVVLAATAHGQILLDGSLAPGGAEDDYATAEHLVTVEDLDGDGQRDLAWEFRGLGTRSIRVLSSGTGAVLRTLPIQEGGLGSLAAADDLDGDGLADYVVSQVENFGTSRLSAYSHRTGLRLWTVTGPQTGDQFGAGIVPAPDLDGDGTGDLLVSCPSRDSVLPFLTLENVGAVSVVSGATGAILETRVLGTSPHQSIGFSLDVLGDPDGDGRVEAVAGGYSQTAYLWEPLHPSVPLVIQPPSSSSPFENWSTQTVAGFGGVGPAHFYIAIGNSETLSGGAGQVTVYSAIDGLEAGILTDPFEPFGAQGFGHRVVDAGDLNGDGVEDLVVIDAPGSSADGAARQWFAYSGNFGFAVLGGDDSTLTPFPRRGVKGGDLDGDGLGEVWFEGLGQFTSGLEPTRFDAFELSAGELATASFDIFDGLGAGTAVALLRDTDGDGNDEVLLGVPHCSVNKYPDSGCVRMFRAFQVSWETLGAPFEQFGAALCALDDVNGDGVADVLVGRPWAQWGQGRRGAVSILSGVDGSVLRQHGGTWVAGRFGAAVARVPDVDLDGVDDYAVGAPSHGAAGVDSGRVRVFSGASGIELSSAGGPLPGARFGAALAGLDLDQDGSGDVLVGAPGDWVSLSLVGAGQVWRIDGASGATLGVAGGSQAFEGFGSCVAALGDVNGDGIDDWIAGAPRHDAGSTDDGRVEVRSGANAALLREHTGAFGERLGSAVTDAGDADVDGFADYAMGAPKALSLFTFETFEQVRVRSGFDGAQLRVFARGPLISPYAIHDDGYTNSKVVSGFGTVLAGGGDRDGDGLVDVIVGMPRLSVPAALPAGPSAWSVGSFNVWSPRAAGTAAFGFGTEGCAGPHVLASLEPLVPGAPVTLRVGGVAPGVVRLACVGLDDEPVGLQLPGLGAWVHLDPAALIVRELAPPITGVTSDFTLPTPDEPGLSGLTVYAQDFLFWTGGCAATPLGWSSSVGLALTFQ